jgi:uncharacterized protein with beta-barrel porin domain
MTISSVARLLSGISLAALVAGLAPGSALAADCTANATTISADCTDYLNDDTIATLSTGATISSPVGGADGALTNTGTITSLESSGTITSSNDYTGKAVGIANTGTITLLDNDGSITTATVGTGANMFAAGIYNRDGASIGTIINDGTISAEVSDPDGQHRAYGIWNVGTLGSLVNTGDINARMGVLSVGGLSSLANDGTISGVSMTLLEDVPVEKIDNTGTISMPTDQLALAALTVALGTVNDITNSGTIDGDLKPGVFFLNTHVESLENTGMIAGQFGLGVMSLGDPPAVVDLLHNGSGGTITGDQMGVIIALASVGQLTNDGEISGTGDSPLLATLSGMGASMPGSLADLSGNAAIVTIQSDIGTLQNNGSMASSSSGTAAALLAVGTSFDAIVNAEGATMSASGAVSLGAGLIGGSVDTLTNDGGIEVEASGAGSLAVGLMTIGGEAIGLDAPAVDVGTLANGGTVTASGDIAMGALLGLASIDSFDNSGTLSAAGTTLGGGLLALSSDIASFTNSGTIAGTGAYSAGMALVGLGAVGDNLSDSGIADLLGGSDNPLLVALGALDDAALETPASITSFDNSGTISGGLLGLYVAEASIGSLENSGTLSSGSVGLYLDSGADLGDIDNSGTITGPEAIAMYGDALFGTITNTGTIAGTIKNRTRSDLVFIGATGDDFGLITGYSADPATLVTGLIESLGADVTFQSGNMRLDSDIDVGTGTVTNAGTLRVDGAVSLTGNYTQSAAGKLVIAATADEIGKFTVSGRADFTDGTIVIVPIGGYRFSGDVANILSAGSLELAGLTLQAGTETIAFDTDSVDGLTRLLATLPDNGPSSAYAEIGAAAGAAGGAMGAALDILSGDDSDAAIDFQSTVLVALLGLDDADQPAAIAQLAPSADTPAWRAGFAAYTMFSNAVAQRQAGRFGGSGGTTAPPVAAYAEARPQVSAAWPSLAGAPVPRSDRFAGQVWAQGLGGVALSSGFDLEGKGLAIGADVALSDVALVGAAGSWLLIDTETSASDTAAARQRIYQALAYGSWYPGDFRLDVQAGASLGETEQSRAIAFLGKTARAAFDGRGLSFRAEAGYDLTLAAGDAGPILLTPLAGVAYQHSIHDGYEETGAGAANLTVDGQAVSNLTSFLGAKLSWTMPTGLGALTPEIRVAWVHDHLTDPVVTTGTLAGADVSIATERLAADGAEVGLAMTLENARLLFGVEYVGQFRNDYESHSGLLKGAIRF